MSDPPVTSRAPATDDGQREQHQDLDSAATRHLCAGVYVDRSFRDLVIRQVHNDSRRRVAPSYGFDLVPVVRHAWRSWFLDTGLALAIIDCLVGALVLGYQLAVVMVVCTIAICILLRIAARIGAEVSQAQVATVTEQWFERREQRVRRPGTRSPLHKRKPLIKAILAGCGVVAVTPIVASAMLGVTLGAALPAAATIGCLLVASAALVGVLRQRLLNAVYHDSLRPVALTRRERVIDEQQSHICVIYDRSKLIEDADLLGFSVRYDKQSPFIGSGKLIHRWLPPVTIQLLRQGAGDMAQREHATPPFRAHELVERLRPALEQLSRDPSPENLPGLQVHDRLYVAEADICADRALLRRRLDESDLWPVIDDHQDCAHHFLEISAPSAGGELVTTVFLRVSVKGRCLSLDVATCALTRTPPDYQVIDAFAEHGTSAVLRSAIRSVLTLPAEFTRLWRVAAFPVVLARAGWALIKDRTHIPRRGITVGARVAVRVEKADDWKNAQLDMTVLYEHMKIIEQRILKATMDFLKDHDVDTSMFEKQATNIINSGVLNMGGKTEVKQSAVGTNAQVTVAAGAEGQDA